MIRAMHNLQCEAGHLHYSPTPGEWEDRTCDRKEGPRSCREPLSQHRDYELPRNSGKVATVNGLTTLVVEANASG